MTALEAHCRALVSFQAVLGLQRCGVWPRSRRWSSPGWWTKTVFLPRNHYNFPRLFLQQSENILTRCFYQLQRKLPCLNSPLFIFIYIYHSNQHLQRLNKNNLFLIFSVSQRRHADRNTQLCTINSLFNDFVDLIPHQNSNVRQNNLKKYLLQYLNIN